MSTAAAAAATAAAATTAAATAAAAATTAAATTAAECVDFTSRRVTTAWQWRREKVRKKWPRNAAAVTAAAMYER